MALIFVDTQIVVLSLISDDDAGDDVRPLRCRNLLDLIHRQGHALAIAAPTMAELLLRPAPEMAHRLAVIRARLRVMPFDDRAAISFARLHHHLATDLETIARNAGLGKRALRFDLQIIATAKSCGAQTLYCHDRNMVRLATGFQPAQGIPDDIPAQQDLRG